MSGLPRVALSIMQPWAWLIVNGHKDIENRTWRYPPRHRGAFLVHAGIKLDKDTHEDLMEGFHPVTGEPLSMELLDAYIAAVKAREVHRGGIVGVASLDDVVLEHASPWFVGKQGFVISGTRPLAFMPLGGALGFFKAEYQAPDA